MSTLKLVITIIQMIVSVVLVVVVIGQSGKSEGLSTAFGGSGESFLARNKTKTMDAMLARATKWIAIAFLVLTLVLCLI